MLCEQCNKNPVIKFPIAQLCNSCWTTNYKKARPGYLTLGAAGFKAMTRDKFTCQSCHKNKSEIEKLGSRLELHHIDGKGSALPREKRNNKIENLLTLCRNCHYSIEIKRRGYANKGLQGRWAYHFKKCITCGKTDSPHQNHGLCNRCFQKTRREYKAKYWREHYSAKLLTT